MEQKELDILKHLQTIQMAELNYRRNREFQIFTWSASILLAIIGALLIRAQGSSTLFTNRGAYWKIVASLVVTGLTFFSAKWQLDQRKFSVELQQVLARIRTKLGCFDANAFGGAETLYPTRWKDWGTRYLTLRTQATRASKISATILLGVVALASILLSWS